MISDQMKGLIDENIAVLSQSYNQKSKSNEGATAAVVTDGTQIRTYINCVTIKVDLANVLKIDGVSGKTKSKMLE